MAGANCVLWQAKLCIATTKHDSQSSTSDVSPAKLCRYIASTRRGDFTIECVCYNRTITAFRVILYALGCNLSEITCFQGMSNNMLHIMPNIICIIIIALF